MTTYDYIVVGSGSAGSVLAARLAQSGAARVLLLEAGGSDRRALIEMPVAWFAAMRTPDLGWGYFSEPEPHAEDRRIPAPRGRVVGGCASINGMMYSRGHPRDYDQWAQMGAAGWSFADILPFFRKSESNWRGPSEYHGSDGPIPVARHQTDRAVYPATIAAAQRLGMRALDDFHGADTEGWSAPDFTIDRGRRASPARLMLRPALKRGNLRLVRGALVHKVVIEQGEAKGVVFAKEGKVHEARARAEVILCAGAFNSPHLLMHSGIGPGAHLREHGLAVLRDLPGVGQNLQDHASLGMVFDASGPFTFDRHLRADRFALALLRWRLLGEGPLAGLPVGAQGFVRSRAGLDRPDLQLLVSPVAMDARIWFPGWRQRRGDCLSVAQVLLYPQSRGQVRLASGDPAQKPRIHLNLLAAEGDRLAFRRFLRFTRTLMATSPLAALVKQEAFPGGAVAGDEAVDAFVRRAIGTAMHPVGTCAMGPGREAVVDARLRVHGVGRLRVVDASIMPRIVGGNTNAPAIMIAEKAAAMIGEDAQGSAPARQGT